jgi:hypothetical protein
VRDELQGWFVDPWSCHEARYFSNGKPTALVRDGDLEGRDAPPSRLPAVVHPEPVTFAGDGVSTDEVPERIFRGQEFERRWGGTRGYTVDDPRARDNWVDRLIVPTFTFLRPSRFSDPKYWATTVPTILLLSIGITVLILLFIA